MNTHYRRSGRLSIWVACATALISAVFIVLIVNRSAFLPVAAHPETTRPPQVSGSSFSLTKPDSDRPEPNEHAAQPLPLPEPEAVVTLPEKAVAADTAAYQAIYARPKSVKGRPHSLFTAFLFPSSLAFHVAPASEGVKALPTSAPEAASTALTMNRAASPEIERHLRQEPQVASFQSPVSDLETRLRDTQARLYLSDLKVAIYAGHSRAMLKENWAKTGTFLQASYPSIGALKPALRGVETALASKAARKLLTAVSRVQTVLEQHLDATTSETTLKPH